MGISLGLRFRGNLYRTQLNCTKYKTYRFTFNCARLNATALRPTMVRGAGPDGEAKNGEETGGGRAAVIGQSDLLCDLFDRARVQPRLQAAPGPPRPDLSAISGHDGAVGTRRRSG